MDYYQARDYLRQVNKFGSVLGLDSIKKLLQLLENPEKDLQVVHVAGTNGKGSTITFLQSILMEAGYRVGRYSSPAVFDDREIIRVNDQYIEKESLAKIITMIKEKCDEMVRQGLAHPTLFEIETAMAFMYFKEKKCDIVLIECGMGGATDATNVLDKVLCSVITTISLDHMQFLGDTIEEITKVKAGIIKGNCPVVMSEQSTEAVYIAEETAKKQGAEFILSRKPFNMKIKNRETFFDYTATNNVQYPVTLTALGTYQVINAVTALEAALVLEKQGYQLKEGIVSGLKKALWSGRLEVIRQSPLIVIDGAHNPGAVKELRKSIDLYFTNKRITFIMGVLADKDFGSEAEIIAERAVKIITVTPDNSRGLDCVVLAKTLSIYNDNVQPADSLKAAVQLALETIEDNRSDMILAFGSLSYLGKLKSIVENNEANS